MTHPFGPCLHHYTIPPTVAVQTLNHAAATDASTT